MLSVAVHVQKISRSFDVWSLRYASEQTDKHTDKQKNRHTNMLIAMLRSPTWGKVIICRGRSNPLSTMDYFV